MLRLQFCNRRRAERSSPGEQLVEHQAEREDVAANGDALPEELLRRHIRRCSRTHIACLADDGKAEVHDADMSLVVEHHVGRLEIAMNDAALMRGGQSRTE